MARKAEIALSFQPETVRLDETRRLAVEVTVTNTSGDILNLRFPTAQRLEIQIKDDAGNVITKWSEDRAFNQALGHVTINPDEKIIFRETISLRELSAGREYFLEAFLPGYPDLSSQRKLQPLE